MTFKATLISVIRESFDIRRSLEHLFMDVSQNYFIWMFFILSASNIYSLLVMFCVRPRLGELHVSGSPLGCAPHSVISLSLSFTLPIIFISVSMLPSVVSEWSDGV